MYPVDIDPQSGCRLPLPRREDLDAAGQRVYDSLADPNGGTLRGLKGPGGILLHSPDLSRHTRPLNRYLRHEAGLGGRVREWQYGSRRNRNWRSVWQHWFGNEARWRLIQPVNFLADYT
jgi:hypothetical protein